MSWPNPTPIKTPLPCYGLEHSPVAPDCIACPHKVPCADNHGKRKNRVPLSRAVFRLVPAAYNHVYDKVEEVDPEIPEIKRLFTLCLATVFNKKLKQIDVNSSIGKHAEEIVQLAAEAGCSLRLFMLANMVGFAAERAEQERIGASSRAKPFTAAQLTGKKALNRALLYAEVCRNQFGTFTLSALSSLSENDYEEKSIESAMLRSEISAGKFIVDYKIRHDGPPYEALFSSEELRLDPHWLAVEDNYRVTVLEQHLKTGTVSEALKNHRFATAQVIGHLKKHRNTAISLFLTREANMATAIRTVLGMFNLTPEDLEVEATPIKDPLVVWTNVGRAIQHARVLRYLETNQPEELRS